MCQVSVGVLGDVCRAVEARIAPHCDAIMRVLLTNLQSNDVQRNIKPQILSAFGDIAIAVGDAFEAYLPHVLQMLQSAQARPAPLPARRAQQRSSRPPGPRFAALGCRAAQHGQPALLQHAAVPRTRSCPACAAPALQSVSECAGAGASRARCLCVWRRRPTGLIRDAEPCTGATPCHPVGAAAACVHRSRMSTARCCALWGRVGLRRRAGAVGGAAAGGRRGLVRVQLAAALLRVNKGFRRAQALSVAQQQAGDEDSYEYNSLLRHGIFEAYSGILNGMSKPKSAQHLTQVAPVRAGAP